MLEQASTTADSTASPAVSTTAPASLHQEIWLDAVQRHPAVSGLRADTYRALLALAQVLAAAPTQGTTSCPGGWERLMARTSLSRSTVAKYLVWLRDHDLLTSVEPGWTPSNQQGSAAYPRRGYRLHTGGPADRPRVNPDEAARLTHNQDLSGAAATTPASGPSPPQRLQRSSGAAAVCRAPPDGVCSAGKAWMHEVWSLRSARDWRGWQQLVAAGSGSTTGAGVRAEAVVVRRELACSLVVERARCTRVAWCVGGVGSM